MKRDPNITIDPSQLVQIVNNKEEIIIDENNEEENEKEIDWEVEQTLRSDPSPEILLSKPHYGFNNQYCMYFEPLMDEIKEIIDLDNPDSTPPSQRFSIRVQLENEKFDPDYYM